MIPAGRCSECDSIAIRKELIGQRCWRGDRCDGKYLELDPSSWDGCTDCDGWGHTRRRKRRLCRSCGGCGWVLKS